MNTLKDRIASQALKMRQQHQQVDIAILHAAIEAGATLAMESITERLQSTRRELEAKHDQSH